MLRDLFSLFPAYAGVIPDESLAERIFLAFPRICGGDPYATVAAEVVQNFSPHMRG